MTVKAAIPTNKAVTRLMCASLVPSLCYDITDYVMAKESDIHALALRSEIDLIGASQKCAGSRQSGRIRRNTTHAGGNNTAAGMQSNRGCDPKRPVHGRDWRAERSRSVKSACLRSDLLHFLERSPKTPYGLFGRRRLPWMKVTGRHRPVYVVCAPRH
jgi:hypothetical protein